MHLKVINAALLIASSVAACVTVLGGIIVITGKLTISTYTTADFLPAQQTMALSMQPSTSGNTILASWFPTLSFTEPAEAIAILEEDGTRCTATFRNYKDVQSDEEVFGNFAIAVSNPLCMDLIRSDDPKLAEDPTYNSLQKGRLRHQPWIYIRNDVLPAPQSIDEHIVRTAMFGNTCCSAIMLGPSIRIDTPAKNARMASTSRELQVIGDPTVAIRLYHPLSEWQRFVAALPQTQRIIIEGSLNHWVTETFGKNIGVQYTLLPLLEHAATIQFHKGPPDTFLVAGTVSDVRALAQATQMIHTSFSKTLVPSMTTKRKLDNRFSALDIRNDPTQIAKETQQSNGWNRQCTYQKGAEQSMCTAVQGRQFMISNDRKTIEQALKNEWRQIPAGGMVNANLLPLHTLFPSLYNSGVILWTREDTSLVISQENR